MTNFEKIKAMSLDDMAKAIYRYDGKTLDLAVHFCHGKPECDGFNGCPDPDTMCPECIEEWLMEEADE